jgi:hypothetical protein
VLPIGGSGEMRYLFPTRPNRVPRFAATGELLSIDRIAGRESLHLASLRVQ